jgi:hypothetical protein
VTLGRGDVFSVVGGAPNARIIEGTINRVDATTHEAFVSAPSFDAGLEFGPCGYQGAPPTVGADCVVAVMTGTTKAWIISWDGPSATVAPLPPVVTLNAVPLGNPGAAVWRLQSYNTYVNHDPSRFDVLAAPAGYAYGWVKVKQAGLYRVTANWQTDRATNAEMMLAQNGTVNGVMARQESYFTQLTSGPGWAGGMSGSCILGLNANDYVGNQVYYDTALNPQYCSFAVEQLDVPAVAISGPVGPVGPSAAAQKFWQPGGTDVGSANFTSQVEFADSLGVNPRIRYTPPVDGILHAHHQTIVSTTDAAWQRMDTHGELIRRSDGATLHIGAQTINRSHVSGEQWVTAHTHFTCNVLAGVEVETRFYAMPNPGNWSYWQGVTYHRARILFTPAGA